jgi:4-amino-4-deoxy-L-arabinose transferase-like glycosyltransferase
LPAVAALTVAAGLLRLWALGGAHPNPYYDAAVRSMGLSLHNFLFAAYEPGGSVAIDKPPLDLWLQVLSVKLLGFGPRGLVAPQALASTASVPLLYGVVRRAFGTGAGLAAAAALAVLPIAVETARSDTMDSLAMTLGVAAAWLVVRAVQADRALYVVAAGAVCGLAFEVKLFEGLIVVPALVVLYWLAAPGSRVRRARALAAAGAALVAVGLAWPVAVSLAPASERPDPLGSSDGTVWSSIFVFNGVDRLGGPRYAHPAATAASNPATPPGPGRLLARAGWDLGRLVGVELLAAVVLGGLALVARPWRRDGPRDPPRLRLALGVAIACWLALGAALFSAQQVLHPRYLEGLSAPVAAALGIGVAAIARLGRAAVPLRLLAAAAVAGSCLYEMSIAPPVAGLVAGGGLAAALLVALRPPAWRRHGALAAGAGAALAATALLLVPARASVELVDARAGDAGQQGTVPERQLDTLSRYLALHTRGAGYEVAVGNYLQAAALIVHDARPVLVLEGVEKRPIATVRTVRAAARRGDLRYALIGGACGRARSIARKHCSPAVRWIRAHSVELRGVAGIEQPGLLFELRPHSLIRSQRGGRAA